MDKKVQSIMPLRVFYKKYIFLSLILCGFITQSLAQQNSIPVVLRSTVNRIKYRVNETERGWTISPEEKPDVLKIPLPGEAIKIRFISDIDSVTVTVKRDERVSVYFLLNKDSALTEIHGIPYLKPATFSKSYIKKHKGKVVAEVPEVDELVHIIMALTSFGRNNNNLIEKGTLYYEKVIKHFASFQSHSTVTLIDSLLKKGQYYNLTMNSCAFRFKGAQIINEGVYGRLGFNNENIVLSLLKPLESFALASGFRKFYKGNFTYYNELIRKQHALVNVQKMWQWLENNFPQRYQSYKVIFSPLVLSSHATQQFYDNGFRETVMFILAPDTTASWKRFVAGGSAAVQGYLSRIIFTEIDHNYVNPTSADYGNGINAVFAPGNKWILEEVSRDYPTPYAIFNEYMTWALFSLYVQDTYNLQDAEEIIQDVERVMIKARGFTRFKEFNRQLLQLYTNRQQGTRVADLYSKILAWCKGQ